MNGKLHSTDDVGERQRFDYWHDCVCDAFVNLDCNSNNRSTFSGRIEIQEVADLRLISMSSDEMTLLRSTRQISKSREDDLLLPVECARKSLVKQDGRDAQLSCGDFVLVDSMRRYEVIFESGFQHTVLKIPRQLILQRVGHVDHFTGVRVDGSRGAGRLASRYIELLSHEAESMSNDALRRVAGVTLDLVAAALATIRDNSTLCETSTRTAWRMRIKGLIDDNLADPSLSLSSIAQALNISPRYVSAIFAAHDISTNQYIWERRLEKCFETLADRSQSGRSISEIAFSFGFNDVSHFSRKFKARYGQSPRDMRARTRLSTQIRELAISHVKI